MNRNQWFMVGLLLVFLGVHFRSIESFTLNSKVASFIHAQMNSQEVASAGPIKTAVYNDPPVHSRTIKMPRWIGWSFISIGSVLILHSLAMKKP